MALFINQGIQPETDNIILEKAKLTITRLALEDTKFVKEGQKPKLVVTLKILTPGVYQGRVLTTKVDIDPNSSFSRNYRALRSSAKKPYVKGEPAQIDIEKILLNKVVWANLSEQENNGNKYQRVNFIDDPNATANAKAATTNIQATAKEQVQIEEPVIAEEESNQFLRELAEDNEVVTATEDVEIDVDESDWE